MHFKFTRYPKKTRDHSQIILIAILLLAPMVSAQITDVRITGQIRGPGNDFLSGCFINLSDSTSITTTSDTQGRFTLQGTFYTPILNPSDGISSMIIKGSELKLQVYESYSVVKVDLYDVSGNLLNKVFEQNLQPGEHTLILPKLHNPLTQGIVFLRININGVSYSTKWNMSGTMIIVNLNRGLPAQKKAFNPIDSQSVSIHCDGYFDQQVSLNSYIQDLGTLVFQSIPPTKIEHMGTSQVWDNDGQGINIDRPAESKPGDLLVLALHRTDDDLPLKVNGWTRMAECYKRTNGNNCSTEPDCTNWANNDSFCDKFGDYGQGGHDLAQSIFYKSVNSNEPNSYRFNLNMDSDGHPGWIILTALRGAATLNPVRDWSHEGCDGSADSKFPSVYGENGDMVLLSQSFDDFELESKFLAPPGTSTFGYIGNSDETGFLFGGLLINSGETGEMITQGPGASNCKDALVSLTIKPK